MAVDSGKYDALIAGLTGGGSSGSSSGALGGGSFADLGSDLGRGPGGPGGGVGDSTRRNGYIPGFPAGYAPSGIGSTGMGYSADDVQAILRGMPPERISEIQRKMQTIGLLPENYKSFGFVDSTMRSGFGELLEASNMRDSNYMTTLDVLTTAGPGSVDEVRKEAARRRAQAMLSFDTRLNTYERTDPASIRQTAEAAFQQALGRKPKKGEVDRFTSVFLARERGAQEKVFDAGDNLAAASRDRTLAAVDMEEAAALGESSGGSESDELWGRVQRMIADSPYKITPGKRTRSYEEQVRLWNEYKAGRGPMAAKPGRSKHGDGRANDLQYSSAKAREWALANAHRYGLHFPIYNPKLGRGKDESWHVELRPGEYEGLPSSGPSMPGAAPISEDVVAQRQDLGAQAVEYARTSNPTETTAYDIGGQFNNLLSILQKGVV